MKTASASALSVMSGGIYAMAELYDITLQNGLTYHFTSFDVPLKVAIFPSTTVNQYLTGMTIKRGAITQEVGLSVQELEITVSPQPDNPAGQALIGGYNIAQACRYGLLDNAIVLFSKLFMSIPANGHQYDTSPAGVAWYQGNVGDIEPVGALSCVIKCATGAQYLTTQMPRNLYQAGCSHTLFDAGCTLSQATFTKSGTVTGVTNTGNFNTSLTDADGYYNLGVMKWTSGNNQGFSGTVRQYAHANGNVQVVLPFPFAVQNGDAFTVYPGCDHTQATCQTKFNNIPHFKAYPFVPVTETLYDGGSSNPVNPSYVATPAGNKAGSFISSHIQQK
jgi:hypothetical protein